MICYVCYVTVSLVGAGARYHVGKIALIDLHVDTVRRTEGGNLHVVTISATFCHSFQVVLEGMIDVCFGGRSSSSGERADILSFRIPSRATTGLGVYELLVIVRMLTHIIDDFGANDMVLFLVTIQLIAEGVKKTIP